jgi:hypothetical protein
MKLDFAKAFDSITWASLRVVMLARGFPPVWCEFMESLFASSRSAILLNGIPGRWIRCFHVLCQGDQVSPCLFLLLISILQRLIHIDGASCPVLQYVDDMIIILHADGAASSSYSTSSTRVPSCLCTWIPTSLPAFNRCYSDVWRASCRRTLASPLYREALARCFLTTHQQG